MRTIQEQLSAVKSLIHTKKLDGSSSLPRNATIKGNVKTTKTRKYKKCPDCGNNILLANFPKHCRKQHSASVVKRKNTRKIKQVSPHDKKVCPKCKKMFSGKLKTHLREVHPEIYRIKYYSTSYKKMTPQQAAQHREALGDNSLGKSEAIQKYLQRVPVPQKYGKYGLPQDKYRWGFYGHSTMSYDIWGRN